MTKLEVYDANGRLKTAAIGGSGAGALDELADVTISSPTEGDVLRRDGAEFVNVPLGDYVFLESEHVDVSAGAADAGKPVRLDTGGQLDASLLDPADLDHGSLSGLGDDDHPQYLRRDLLTAKGDLYVATSSGALSRLGVGTDGQVLAADSAQAEGVAWTTPAGGGSAATIDYTPAESSDWDSVPVKVAPALDELAERVEIMESDPNRGSRLLARDEGSLAVDAGVIYISSGVGRYVITPETGDADIVAYVMNGTEGDIIMVRAADGTAIAFTNGGNIARAFTVDDRTWSTMIYDSGAWVQIDAPRNINRPMPGAVVGNTLTVDAPGMITLNPASDVEIHTIANTVQGDVVYVVNQSATYSVKVMHGRGNIYYPQGYDLAIPPKYALRLINIDGTNISVDNPPSNKVFSRTTTLTPAYGSQTWIDYVDHTIAPGILTGDGYLEIVLRGVHDHDNQNQTFKHSVQLGSTYLLLWEGDADAARANMWEARMLLHSTNGGSGAQTFSLFTRSTNMTRAILYTRVQDGEGANVYGNIYRSTAAENALTALPLKISFWTGDAYYSVYSCEIYHHK